MIEVPTVAVSSVDVSSDVRLLIFPHNQRRKIVAIVFRCEKCGRRYKVPEEKAGKRAKCSDCGERMTVPAPPKMEELPSGGVAYRYKEQERDFEPAVGDGENIEVISDHIEQHIGEIESVFHEILSDIVHIDVHVIEPTDERPFYTLVTSGMSDLPMTVPEGAEEFQYAELMIYLPDDWPMSQEDFEDESSYWPVRLLKVLSRFPHEYNSWLAEGHTLPNGDPAEPYAENTNLVCALLAPPFQEEEEFWTLEIDDEKTINFFLVIPLYKEEMNCKLQRGVEELFERFEKHDVPLILDPQRKNSCRKRFGLF